MSYRAQVKGRSVKRAPRLGKEQEEGREHMKRLHFKPRTTCLLFSHSIWCPHDLNAKKQLITSQAEYIWNWWVPSQLELEEETLQVLLNKDTWRDSGSHTIFHCVSNWNSDEAQINQVREAEIKQVSPSLTLCLTPSEGVFSPLSAQCWEVPYLTPAAWEKEVLVCSSL